MKEALTAFRTADRNRQTLLIGSALAITYVIWGSTYLGIAIALETFPPFLMAGMRFTVAGLLLYWVVRRLGERAPTRTEWRNATIVGMLFLLVGNGLVVYAEQTLPSSVVALTIATSPLLTAALAIFVGKKSTGLEWAGLAIGMGGVAALYINGSTSWLHPAVFATLMASLGWAIGSNVGERLPQPPGLMAAAAQMLTGGIALLLLAALTGERVSAMPSTRSIAALVYLTLFGSLLAFSAYRYLLDTTSVALATSSAYVNPIVAVLLGVGLANEPFDSRTVIATALIVASVALIALGKPAAPAAAAAQREP